MTEPSVREALALESLVARVADEFREGLKHGDRPDVDAIVARYPEHAAVLREVLASLELIDRSLGEAGPPAADPDLGTLGDFRLLREVGRGGMGVVYEAVQISLDRRVALKVLPFAATLDPRHLQRFRTEAQAAAHLHHTNIVPVYAVGTERGVHYYAMQYIDGQTLAEWLRSSWQVDPDCEDQTATGASHVRTVARLALQAALALDHAHQHGVVHRDVKPANLLVEATGQLWVTDFGLAQVQSDTRLTITGDLVGTLRYMSPEQALARRQVVNHRTDVYSLGATLYELLTFSPAFGGADRQELLRQIAFDEPVAPRKRNRAIPPALEVVVQKAMAKEACERYATAQELADDLGRFLRDEPIRARRPSLRERLARWVRRHRGVARMGMLLLVVMTVGSSVAAVLLARERDRAVAQREKAIQAISLLTAELNVLRPGEPAGLNPVVTREALERVFQSYRDFLDLHAADPELHQPVALARRRMVQLHNRLAWLFASPRQADPRDVRRAIEYARLAVAEEPENWAFRNTLGVALCRGGAFEEAIAELTRSCKLRGEFDSYNVFFLAMAHWKLGRAGEAREWYRRGVEWMQPWPGAPELVAFRDEAKALLGER